MKDVGFKVGQLQWWTFKVYCKTLPSHRPPSATPCRNKALAIFGWTGALGSIIDFLLGGILGLAIGWRWMFYLTAIIGFSMAVLGAFVIPNEKSVSKMENRRIDFVGIVSFTLGIVTVIYYLSKDPLPDGIGFVVYEIRINYPIMPPHIWNSRRLIASCVNFNIVTANLNAMLFYPSLVLQDVLHYTALNGIRLHSGVVWAQIAVYASYWAILFPALILNLCGMAPNWLCCQINFVADADDENQGVVGAVNNVSLQLGAPIGVALNNNIANTRNSPTAVGVELLPGYHAADAVMVAEKPESAFLENVDLEIVGHAVEVKSVRNSEAFDIKSGDSTIHETLYISLESPHEKPAKTQQ
ncbi:hypothetical protein BG015_008250 [Linnemannia schmuckeri]|uniref:Major facilitator superfamily (MFS) profile domain-containing protein n=1 Tax=Linnemannia schmuckeri TaxID=64567 RepID=A0A9P5RZX4_9FUNG|nr:hypothetical protein BG015_008250 [Linnemannia schmuckeri]